LGQCEVVVGDVEAVAERGYQGLRKLTSALHVIEDFTPFEKEHRQCASLETILQTTLNYMAILLPLESFRAMDAFI
jgi:hypothetical protein